MGHVQEKHGTIWDLDGYRPLFTGLRDGLDDEEVAAAAGRTVKAVQGRCRWLLGEASGTLPKVTGRAAMAYFREVLAEDPEWDWAEHVRKAHDRTGPHLWDEASDAMLRAAWEHARPRMPDLARRLEASEQQVARRLIALCLAEHLYDVADRLGCTADGALDVLSRLSRATAEVTVWVLVVTCGAETVRVSVHPNEADAERTRDGLLDVDADAGPGDRWTIASRVVGEGSARSDASGAFADLLRDRGVG